MLFLPKRLPALILACLPLIAGVTAVVPATGAVSKPTLTYQTLNHKGWKDSVALTAGPYRVVVVPAIGGRIMEYSVNGRGPVWTNENLAGKVQPLDPKAWANYGGYKTWPAPQSRWGWPPDPLLDAAPATVTPWQVNGRLVGLRIVGQESPKAGIRFEKWVRLDPQTGRLTLRQTMRALSRNTAPVRWGVWDITQVESRGRVVVPLDPKSRHEGGVYFYDEKAKQSDQWKIRDGLLLIENKNQVSKYGVETNRGWMAWLDGSLAYVKRFPRMKAGQEYPDQYSIAQIYTHSSDLPYTEMEVAGPLVNLKSGETTHLNEEWRLVRLPKPVRTDADALAAIRILEKAGHLRPL